ncbi:MAG: nucleotidyltransferase [Elusimicrobia bacterium]|nr:nucleotidyltransferase [Elusimicrobiota bacterium]MBD3412060.1 nucleotidyltransferase [Elusimicrobiota bacterium]
MSPQKKLLNIIQQHSSKIKLYKVKKIGIFGSFARSNQNSKSDIDILVEFEQGGKTFDNYMDLKFFLEELFHRKVDLVIKEALKSRIKNLVLSEVQYA